MSSTSRLSTPVSLLTPSELHQLLSDPKGKGKGVVVVDGSWHMPNLDPKRNGFSEFRRKRIENAAFWDLYAHLDTLSSLLS